MENFFKSPVVRAVCALIAVVLLSLLIWFVGPMLSFGGLRPLGDVSTRVWSIALLVLLTVLLVLRWPVGSVFVVLGCLLVWYATPQLAFGGAKPFEAVWLRVLIIGIIALVYAIVLIFSIMKMLHNDRELAQKIFNPGKKIDDDLAKEEVKTMQGITKLAMVKLKAMRLGSLQGAGVSLFRRLVEGKRYLYELPWYMIIGKSGAGKTTVLLNSGLQFPTADVSSQTALSKDRGTQNCAWWFSNEAVLVDTAGRFTVQGTATGADKALHAAEWRGFLGVLRKARPRAPINGALLAIDVADIVQANDAELMTHAATLRSRLGELRNQLGVRFPVYVVVTKADLLKGFNDYFGSLTAEGRTQIWGFTLPWVDDKSRAKAKAKTKLPKGEDAPASALGAKALPNGVILSDLALTMHQEFKQLQHRIEDGINTRLQEEFEPSRRSALYSVPQEFGAMAERLTLMLEAVFADSRYDTTQLKHSLRGVYITSCTQADQVISAQKVGVVARLRAALDKVAGKAKTAQQVTGQRSFFASDVLTKVVFPEAHLVRPNLMWETRFRFMRLLGHAVVAALFIWLLGALLLSNRNNAAYLEQVGDKTTALHKQVNTLFTQMNTNDVPEVLTAAQDLTAQTGLDLLTPSLAYTYGLYTAPPLMDATDKVYADIHDQFVVPTVIKRMEGVLRASIAKRDTKTTYDTLRVYLMMHEKDRFKATDVREWVLKDWQSATASNSATTAAVPAKPLPALKLMPAGDSGSQSLAVVYGGRAAMMGHFESLFSGDRIVQSGATRNEGLVQGARELLGMSSSSERLYDRAKASITGDLPDDFNLVRVIGPQVGTLLSRVSGQPLEKGVPGLFSYEGYHDIFSKQLPKMIAAAQEDDAWAMGKSDAQKKRTLDDAATKKITGPLVDDIRRQYLTEYAQHWTEFLADIRPLSGGSLGFDLNVLRQLAAPDSPITKLAKAAARETTLTRNLNTKAEEEKSLLDKASDQLDKKAKEINKNLGLRTETKQEKELVDNRFSGLREVVTGQGDGPAAAGPPATAPKGGLENVTTLINEFYTVLVVADTAITGNSLPPAGLDVAAKLRLEAGKLPAPLQGVLMSIANTGSEKVAIGSAAVLRVQAQAQLERLNTLMNLQVTEPCRRGLEGRYPFAATTQEVNIDDFNAVFAAGGATDEFFTKFLLPMVDTTARPWKYKPPSSANMMVGIESTTQAPAPATAGPTLQGELLKLLATSGPNLESFAKVVQIREAYFREPGAKRFGIKMDIKVLELDSGIIELLMDFDGQVQRYSHGPRQALTVSWPGPKGGAAVELGASPRIKLDTSLISVRGPWSVMRLLERGRINSTANTSRITSEFNFEGRKTLIEITTAGQGANPLTSDMLKTFKCPARLSA